MKRMQTNNTSGGTGIEKRNAKWYSSLVFMGERYRLGPFFSLMEAVWARNSFIIDNELWEYPLYPIRD